VVPALRAHRTYFAFEDIDCTRERDLGLVIAFMRDQLAPLRLASNLRFGCTMLMMLASFDMHDNMYQVLLSLSQFLDSGFCCFTTRRGEIRHDMPSNIHQALSPSLLEEREANSVSNSV
jgi:hypothetical protein